MLIVNGKITRVDVPAAATSGGDESWTPGAAVDVGVTIDQPTFNQRRSLGASIEQASAVIYAIMSELPGGNLVNAGYRLVASLVIDGVAQPAVTYRVVRRIPRVHEELTHLELYCEEV